MQTKAIEIKTDGLRFNVVSGETVLTSLLSKSQAETVAAAIAHNNNKCKNRHFNMSVTS